ncbi:acetyl-CoA C-acetyltransferase [Nocardia sp. NPDC050712]|uniref:acetyl-CoA C-acetyltransferase n=1 Tax=Nocardia sp. NPDC050712 TaxID=3155518 RepID=UPI0034046140
MTSRAYVLDAVRTPVGRRGGGLAGVHAADLGAHILGALVTRSGVDPALVEDVIMGCCDTIGSQSGNIGRTSWLAAGLPDHVPGVTVDRQCGSSQQAIHFAAQAVLSDTADLVVAAGLQTMSDIPMSAAMLAGRQYGFDDPFSGSAGWRARYGETEISQFRSADMIARKWDLSRAAMEEFALGSNEKACEAIDSGRFATEIVPLADVATDECPRRGTTSAKMAALPALQPDSRITAALASQNGDGAAATLIASERFVAEHGLRPRALIRHLSVYADDPVWMLTGPIEATRRALHRSGLTLSDIDLFEVNEAFASVAMAWLIETGADPARVNVNGGGIALGHPLGATGAKLFTTLLHELERRDARYGLQTMCEGGGTANVLILERLD